ncbi:MAG: hypothetical protein VB111_03620 [Clostridiaceae bacterium]|nr:hypothetical protein [Clostridiaceae bacterium]
MKSTVFFMGANAPSGFVGLYDELQGPHMRRLYILKGGPGNGKSTYLRTIADAAEERGLYVERISCASDPGSLDGVYLPERGIAWIDGTSPHVAEPKLPGARDVYVNLGELWNIDALEPETGTLTRLFESYAKAQAAAVRYIRAAGAVYDVICALPEGVRFDKLERRTKGIAARELRKKGKTYGKGREIRRFLSGITPIGQICRYDSAFALCERIYELTDAFGIGSAMLETLREAALRSGYDIITSGHPLAPEKLTHLLIPGAGVGFVTSDAVYTCDTEPYRRLRLETLVSGDTRKARQAYKENRKLLRSLLEAANQAQRCAKTIHDRIEERYNPTVDFEKLRAMARDMVQRTLD